jgi:hypothetical protein
MAKKYVKCLDPRGGLPEEGEIYEVLGEIRDSANRLHYVVEVVMSETATVLAEDCEPADSNNENLGLDYWKERAEKAEILAKFNDAHCNLWVQRADRADRWAKRWKALAKKKPGRAIRGALRAATNEAYESLKIVHERETTRLIEQVVNAKKR